MDNKNFEKVFFDQYAQSKDMLCVKGKEYGSDEDRLHNFKRAGQKRNQTPEQALMGMKVKHEISIDDMINDIEKGILPTEKYINEKIGDDINYNILLKALILERIKGG